MVTRVLAGFLWLVATAYGWNFVAAASGMPSALGLVLGLAVAGLVVADPLHRIWPARPAPKADVPALRTAHEGV